MTKPQSTTPLGQMLRDMRFAAGLTAAQAAKRAKLSQGHLTKLELGTVTPTPKALDALSRAYGCSRIALYAAAGVAPSELRKAFAQTPELFFLLMGMSQKRRRELYQDLVGGNPRANPERDASWSEASAHLKRVKRRLLR